MNILQSNYFSDLVKTTKLIKKSYFVALLILATLAIGNYVVVSKMMESQTRISELKIHVREQKTHYLRIRELIQLSLNNKNSLLHQSIQSELKTSIIKLRLSRIDIENIIKFPSMEISIWMGFPRIVTGAITTLPINSQMVESKLEMYLSLDPKNIQWHFSVWAPLSLLLAEKGLAMESVKKAMRELNDKSRVTSHLSAKIHEILMLITLLILLLEYMIIFKPLLLNFISSFNNIKTINAELNYLSTHDDVTEMGNNRLFLETLAQISKKSITLFLIDFNDFKSINNVYGHDTRDYVLLTLASRLKEVVPASRGSLFRLSCDQFVAIVYDLEYRTQVEQLVSQFISIIKKPICFDGKIILTHSTIGVNMAHAKEEGLDIKKVLKQLRFSLRTAQKSHDLSFHIYNFEDNDKNILNDQLFECIGDALRNGEIIPFYQPIININDGEIIGAEALARWVDKKGNIISPGEFLPIVEELGLMNVLTETILKQVHDDHEKLLNAGIEEKFISVNFPESILADTALPMKIVDWLENENIDYLHVEILETVLLHHSVDIIKRNLEALVQLGAHISMDDFGTGYASLSHLVDFPCHTLKIDRSFVANIPFDNSSELIIRGIIDIALSLGINIVAEGIKTKAQKDFFSKWENIAGQGYMFHYPQPFSSFINLLKGESNV